MVSSMSPQSFTYHVWNKLETLLTIGRKRSKKPKNTALRRRRGTMLRRTALPAHPIHRLPPELIAHILVLASAEDNRVPIIALGVSRGWRTVAFYTPRLWRRITLTPHIASWDRRIQLSGRCSLDIELISRLHCGVHRLITPSTAQAEMSAVLPHVNRWRSLDISFSIYHANLWRVVLSPISKLHAPLLESLTLIYPLNDDPSEFQLFSGSASSLRRAHLNNVRLVWSPRLFGALTYLDYTHHPFTVGVSAVIELVEMLQVCEQLVDLRISFTSTEGGRPPYHRIYARQVTLHSLLHLEMDCRPMDNHDHVYPELWTVLTLLHLPALSDLRLSCSGGRRRPFRALSAFFGSLQLPASLKRISLERGFYHKDVVPSLFASLPRLIRLRVRTHPSGDGTKSYFVYKR